MPNKEKKPQTVESLKLEYSKKSHRYHLLFTAIAFTIFGIVFGYFLSINVINDTQSKVVNSIEVTLKD